MNRRKFLKLVSATTLSAPFLFLKRDLGTLEALAADPYVQETDANAKALKFCTDADKGAKDKKSPCNAERGKKERKEQYCWNCQLFQKATGEKLTAEGKCMILPQGKVHGNSWCMSWVQNPSAK